MSVDNAPRVPLGTTADLNELIRKQAELQRAIGGSDPRERSESDQMEYVREMVLAATSELHEALDECGWKTWASSKHVNHDAMFAELCDVLQFWMNLITWLGRDGTDVARQLDKKRMVNWQRVTGDYDGVSTKCPVCKRAYDDAAVLCSPERGCVKNGVIIGTRWQEENIRTDQSNGWHG